MQESAQKKAQGNAMRLNTQNLAQLPSSIPKPSYDRAQLKCGIVHMSVGGFHRSHQALYIHDLMQKNPSDWMIAGVGMLPSDSTNVAAMNEQDVLYSILERTTNGDELKICGGIKEIYHAPANPAAVVERLMDPDVKILSLTITEKGYCYNQQGDLDLGNPNVKSDLESPENPKTAYGYIVNALARRRKVGMKPFTVMSCDNLPGNGHLTQKLVLQFADQISKDLSAWIKAEVSFPNCMVDRITPVTTPEIVDIIEKQYGIEDKWPVVCEDFRQWVLEDKFCNGRPAFEEVGVQLVQDVEPYEKMKVRLLNGSHSALSYLSYLMGYRRVDLAMADPLIAKFVRTYMDKDITPSVPDVPGIDLDKYKDKLIERFANKAIGDQVQRLAEDGSQKIPNAILPCIRYALENGGSIKFAALALAGWLRYLSGVDESNELIEIKDPAKAKMQDRIKADPKDPTGVLGLNEIFGDVGMNGKLIGAVSDALTSLHEKGAKKTLEEYLAGA